MILNGTVAASKGEVLCFSTNSFCVCFVFFFCDVTTQRIFTKFSPIFTKSSHGTTMKSHPPPKKKNGDSKRPFGVKKYDSIKLKFNIFYFYSELKHGGTSISNRSLIQL